MPLSTTLRPAVGPWVDDDRFWNRDHELRRLIELLDEGASVSLIAPRRVGKTSLMREASRRIRERYTCLHLDLESAHTPAEFFTELLRASERDTPAYQRLLQAVHSIIANVTELKVSELSMKLRAHLTAGWESRAEGFVKALVELERPPILFLDEVPVFIHRVICGDGRQPTPAGIREADLFLSWLRRALQTHQSRLRAVMTGSIGIEPLLHRVGLTATINHYTPLELRPWDVATARGCLQALARGKELSFASDADALVVQRLGAAIPHHVQLFFAHLADHVCQAGATAIFPGDVEAVYDKQMLGVRGKTALAHYETRLEQVLDPAHRPLAIAILTRVAIEDRLPVAEARTLAHEKFNAIPDEFITLVLGILEHDGYLTQDIDSREYRFESKYVRDWWRMRFAMENAR